MQELDVSIYQRDYYMRWAMDPGPALNTSLTFEISGNLNLDLFKKAIHKFVQHSENQRSYFVQKNNDIKQVIVDYAEVRINQYDFRSLEMGEAEKKSDEALQEIYEHVFDLHVLPLFRYDLISMPENKIIFVVTFHHIISDAYVATYVVKTLSKIYNDLHMGVGPSLKMPPAIKDYIRFEKQHYAADKIAADIDFWEKELSGVDPKVHLFDMRASRSRSEAGSVGSHSLRLDEITTSKLRQFARDNKVTPFLLMAAIWSLLLSRYSNQQEVVLTYPIDVRPAGFKGLLGCFINTVPIKINVDENKSIATYLQLIARQRKKSKTHQRISLFEIARIMRGRHSNTNPNFNASIVVAHLGHMNLNLDGCTCKPIPSQVRNNPEDLTLHYEITDCVDIVISYSRELFDAESISEFAKRLHGLVNKFISSSEQLLHSISILTPRERDTMLYKWNNTSCDYACSLTIHQLFEEQVKRSPENIAVIFDNTRLSYNDINIRANQMARLIRSKYHAVYKHDLPVETIIGLCVERSVDMLVSILAILKAGAAYLPLDPNYPSERLEYMLKQSCGSLVVSQKKLTNNEGALVSIDSDRLLIIDSTEVKSRLKLQGIGNLPNISRHDSLVYVIYTSGSTGRPKGVMQEHGACLNRILWFQNRYKIKPSESYLHKIPLSFDASFYEIFWTLCFGGSLVVAKDGAQGDAAYICDSIYRHQVNNIHFLPSLLSVFCEYIRENSLESRLTSLKRVFCTGEALTFNHVASLNEILDVEMHNLYGPTEAGEISYYDCSTLDLYTTRTIPIGKPISNTGFYVLDRSFNLCPLGAPGELYIGGAGLARGYLNQDKLTKDRFILNPFASELGLEPTDRIYKTGDIVRWLPDGNIEYIGRADFQVKIRGFRVELGEIENILSLHKCISQAIVIAYENNKQKYLVAYYVVPSDADSPLINDLRKYLSDKLPDYMNPDVYFELYAMPLTSNGKIDRRALPTPNMDCSDAEYVAPRNDLEQKLCVIFADALQLARVGIKDDFFAMGGNSILAVNIVTSIGKELGFMYSVVDILRSKNIYNLSSCDRIPMHEQTNNMSIDLNGLHYMEEALLMYQLKTGAMLVFNDSCLIKPRERVSYERLVDAAIYVMSKYEILRSNYKLCKDRWYRVVNKLSENICSEITIGHKDELQATVLKLSQIRLNLGSGSLLRFCLINLPGGQYIFILAHHALVDATTTVNIILPHLYQRLINHDYDNKFNIQSVAEHQKLSSRILRHYRNSFDVKLEYWRDITSDCEPINIQNTYGSPRDSAGCSIPFVIDEKTTSSLRKVAIQLGVSMYTVMYSLFSLMMLRVSGSERIAIATYIDERMFVPECSGIAGCFMNNIYIASRFVKHQPLKEYIIQVRNDVQEAILHAIPYNDLLEIDRDKVLSLSDVQFNMKTEELKEQPYDQHQIYSQSGQVPQGLYFEIDVKPERILGRVRYKVAMYDHYIISSLMQCYQGLAASLQYNLNSNIAHIDLLNHGCKNLLQGWGAAVAPYPKDKTVSQLFEEQVKITPNNFAAIIDNQKLTYQELNKKSNQLARLIRYKYKQQNKQELKPDSLVGLCVEKSLDMMVGIIGIIKAGAAYVPLDPALPQDRLRFMIEDSIHDFIITQKNIVKKHEVLNNLSYDKLLVIDSPSIESDLEMQSSDNLGVLSVPSDLAYVIYTSGSTGMPKGVPNIHRGLVNLVVWYRDELKMDCKDGLLVISNLSFDLTAKNLFAPLLAGAAVYLIKEYDIEEIKKIIEEKEIRFINCAPSAFYGIICGGIEQLKSLKVVVLGGESIQPEIVEEWFDRYSGATRFLNSYGPSESSDVTSVYEIKSLNGMLPIGKPIPNKRVYILDNNLMLCPIGVRGELYIGGVGLARGYLNQENLTKERFIINPFAKDLGLPESDIIYKTGDLVRWTGDGNIEYLGRNDSQVQVRGFRVELGEIEKCLCKHNAIYQACVLDVEEGGNKYLVAYYVCHEDINDIEVDALRSYLLQFLPGYMIPQSFVKLDNIPLTPNGKIDKARIREYGYSFAHEEYLAPGNEIENALVKIWSSILKVDKVGVNDDFFKIGGTSLILIHLVTSINKKLGLSAPISWAFRNPTVALQAKSISRDGNTLKSYQEILTIKQLSGSIPLFIVHPAFLGGEIYLRMAPYFNDDTGLLGNIYAIESYNLAHITTPVTSIEELASIYIRSIKEMHPHGPYFIGGWSFGCLIAYEIIQQLQASGDEVLSLYMLAPSDMKTPKYSSKVQAQIDTLLRNSTHISDSKVDKLIISFLKYLGASDEQIEIAKDMMLIEDKMYNDYQLLPNDRVDTVLISPTKMSHTDFLSVKNKAVRQKLFALTRLPYDGFARYMPHIKQHKLESDHYSIMHVPTLIEQTVAIIVSDMQCKIRAWKSK